MFILNRANNNIQECNNKDVLAACKKDEKHYAVAETAEELNGQAEKKAEPIQEPIQEPQEGGKGETPKELKPEEAKKAPEGTEEPQNEEKGALNEVGDAKVVDLESKTVAELRELAKKFDIKGYANMNKGTLVALIMDAQE